MTLVQLEYIVALDTYRHFVTAAEKCFITQPTLSMQVQKLEDELGVKIFDRSKHPLKPTPIGEEIILQARKVLQEAQSIKQMVKEEVSDLEGKVKVAIIPTLAPYLVPLFLSKFLEAYPQVNLYLEESQTEEIIRKIHNQTIDIGIVATPLNEKNIIEIPLFEEAFVGYVSAKHPLSKKTTWQLSDLESDNLWLLSQGHCFREQIIHICQRAKQPFANLFYESGSLETLKKMVDKEMGYTLLPELALADLNEQEQKRLRRFKNPEPARAISLIVHQHFYKKSVIKALKSNIIKNLPAHIHQKESLDILSPLKK